MKGYNAANAQQTLFYDTRITLKYLTQMRSLKVVLICIAYPSLWSQLFGTPEQVRDYFYACYWDIRYPDLPWYDIHIYSKILQYGNDKAWKFALKGFKVNLTSQYNNNGWFSGGMDAPINDSNANVIISKYNKFYSGKNFHDNVNDVKNLLKELSLHKISVVFFSPPVTHTLSKHMNDEKWRIIDSTVSDFCSSYHCKWFDYHNDSRFNNDDFRDVWHLNENGAAKFSKIINEEIIRQYETLTHQ